MNFFNITLKSGLCLSVETKLTLEELCRNKINCLKAIIFNEVEIRTDGIYSLGQVLIDLYSVETVKQIKNKGE